MKKLNVYSVYLDDGKDVFRVTVPAASKKDAAEYVRCSHQARRFARHRP